jgi:Cu-processing system permease protein
MNALTIARFTIHEAVSRRLILAGLVLSLVFVGLYTLGFVLLYRQDVGGPGTTNPASDPRARAVFSALMTLLGLYAVSFLSGFLALFLSVGSISGEVESGALHAVLARPIRRAELVVGRWLGFVVLVGIYVGLMAGLLLLIAYAVAGYEAMDPGRVIALMVLGSIVLLTVSLFGSTWLSTLANGVVVFTLFGLAWMGGIIEAIGNAIPNQTMVNLGIAVSLLIPSDAIWRGASYSVLTPLALIGTGMATGAPVPFASSTPPAAAFVLWALAYLVAFLLAAIAAFSRRDL